MGTSSSFLILSLSKCHTRGCLYLLYTCTIDQYYSSGQFTYLLEAWRRSDYADTVIYLQHFPPLLFLGPSPMYESWYGVQRHMRSKRLSKDLRRFPPLCL